MKSFARVSRLLTVASALTAACFALTLTGCGEPGLGTVKVEGTLLVDGQPMEGVFLIFNPDNAGGRAASGRTDAQGKYSLTTEINGDGALPGSYKISVTKHENPANDLPTEVDPNDEASMDAIYNAIDTSKPQKSKNMIDRQYENHLGSGLIATVESGGNNVFDFDVKGAK